MSVSVVLEREEAEALLAAVRRGTFEYDPFMGENISGACEHGQPTGWHCHSCGERNMAENPPDSGGYRGSAAGPKAMTYYYARCGGCGSQTRLRSHRDVVNKQPHLSRATLALAVALGEEEVRDGATAGRR